MRYVKIIGTTMALSIVGAIKVVPDACALASYMWLVNLDSLARYFEQGDPAPAEQSQTAHGIRQIG